MYNTLLAYANITLIISLWQTRKFAGEPGQSIVDRSGNPVEFSLDSNGDLIFDENTTSRLLGIVHGEFPSLFIHFPMTAISAADITDIFHLLQVPFDCDYAFL